MDYDEDKIDEYAPALHFLVTHARLEKGPGKDLTEIP
jgi:hypothetical protein